MIECPNCKKQHPDNMRFCDNCGTPLSGAAQSGTIEPGTIESGTIQSGTIESGTINTGTVPPQQQFQQAPPQQQFQQAPPPQQFQQAPPLQQFQQAPPQQQQFQQQYQQPQPQQYQQQYRQPQPQQMQWGGQPQQQWGAPVPKKKSKLGLIVGIIIAVVVIIVVAVLFLLGIIPSPFGKSAQDQLRSAAIGETVKFGKYEQDNNTGNGKEDIEWIVLQKEGDRVLLISKKVLDCQPFHSSTAAITWEKSSIRTFCNSSFYKEAFDQNEQGRVLDSSVNADGNPQKTTSAQGNSTTDKVFLLSAVEIAQYFTTEDGRKCDHTDYSRTKGGYVGDNGAAVYWLRTMGTIDTKNKCATIVQAAGSIGYNGRPVAEVQSVRPAIWVSTK